ncbi:hypothetical protein PHYC_03735 [Phycisphaerales bacterium]|nr:hypothetical protein PHYC_03735 [Phycisphaerales bacterium]
MPADDRELLLQANRGHPAAAEALWARHAAPVLAYASAILGRRAASDAADDIVQQVFCRILEASESTLAAVNDPRAWLLASARNAALQHLRAGRREHNRRARSPHPDRPQAASQHTDLERALQALPRRLREIIILRHVAELSFDQLAVAVGIPRSTAASRYALAVELLDASISSHESQPRTQPRPIPEVRHA